MRLLLVEDDGMLGASIERGLRLQGHAVDWVRDGQAAERALAGEAYGVVLSINGTPVTGVDQLRELVAKARKQVALLVQRGEARIFVPVAIG